MNAKAPDCPPHEVQIVTWVILIWSRQGIAPIPVPAMEIGIVKLLGVAQYYPSCQKQASYSLLLFLASN